MRAALKSVISRTPAYPLAKEVYRHTMNRGYLKTRRHLMDFYGALVPKPSLVFDVGANRGAFVDAFLRLGARVCAVEPHPICAQELKALYGRRPTFELAECALGAEPGEAQLFLGENGMDNVSTLSEDYRRDAKKLPGLAVAGWNQSVAVRVDTLDRLVAVHGVPDFCKIDVEGYEIQVLRGLSRSLPLLQFEYQPWSVEKAVECMAYLQGLGPCRFNITMSDGRDDGVSLQPQWTNAAELIDLLRNTVAPQHCVGDIFVKRA